MHRALVHCLAQAAREVRRSAASDVSAANGPGHVRPAAAGEASAVELTRRRVARRVQPVNGGATFVVGDAHSTGATHGAFEYQCHLPTVLERVDAILVEGGKEVGLTEALHLP